MELFEIIYRGVINHVYAENYYEAVKILREADVD